MPQQTFLSIAEQIAARLREDLARGRWTTEMPGRVELARDFGVSDQTTEAALVLLEKQGLLAGQGPGRRRRVAQPTQRPAAASLRIAILVGEPADQRRDIVVDIKHGLTEAGHVPFFAPWFMPELGLKVSTITRKLERTEADAWIVLSGSRELLEWFVVHDVPVFALFGRRRGLPVAGVGPDKPPAIAQATRRLIELDHRRIVLLALRAQRLPVPGASVQPFLDELAAHGMQPGPFHLPDWEEDLDSFHSCLDGLFRITPPTAFIVDEANFFFATLLFLTNRRLRIPADVSLICTDGDPRFAWCRPSIAHIRWDDRPVTRRALRWAAHLACGERDLQQTLTKAEFIEGGTIGPAP